MHAGGLIRKVAGLMGRRRRPELGVRYTPECAYCGIPDDAATRYPGGFSVCRDCSSRENEDGI
ncbi:MAG: hypothetical protein F4Y25_00455 [Chloroflexi bacterium]|nr:hypothetical protein [Chloroflexota bacterium]